MPHVASALKNHVPDRPLAARPAPASDRAPSTPFASLLDDSAPAPERPPQPAADDHGARAARSDQAQPPAKSTDSKAAKAAKATKAKDDTNTADAGNDAKTGKTDKTDTTDTTTGDGKVIADAKTGKPTEAKDAKPVSDGKATDGLVVAVTPADPMPTITTAEATVTALPPAVVQPGAPVADNTATAATVATPAKADALAALQAGTAKADNNKADNNKADNDAALTAKAATQPHGEAKPQGLAGDGADKDALAQARGELARNELARGELASGELARGELADTAHHAKAAQAQPALAADALAAVPKAGADAALPIALTAPLQTSAPSGATPAASAPMPQPAAIPLAGVAIEIASKALAGTNHFEIRLDPPDLGRIEVRLDVDRDGNVTSRMIADRADTLDLLRRDVSGLERALQDAGLKTSDNGLQFSLRDQSAQQQQSGRASDITRLVVEDDMLPTIDAAPRSYSRLAGQGSGVDIHV